MDVRTTSRGQRRGAAWTPVTPGAHRLTAATDPWAAELRAWASVLPAGTVFTHLTAAQVLGLWLPPLPSRLSVVVQVPPGGARPQRRGLRAIRTLPLTAPTSCRGVPLAGVADVLLALCHDLDDLDAVIAVDSALHSNLVDRRTLEEVAGRRRRGAPRLRRVLARADSRSESAWETVLRELHRIADAPVTPQFVVRDSAGAFVARGDLRLDGVEVLHEYDGHHHLEVGRQRSDLRRLRRLTEVGWDRRGYTSDDLLHRAVTVLRDVDLSLGRTHEPARVKAWHQLLRTSALTASGRARLAARLG